MLYKNIKFLLIVTISLKFVETTVVFPASSTIGIFAAIAIPIDLTNRNVFVSYNFEANYNLPYLGSDFLPGPLNRAHAVKREINENMNNTFTNLKLFPSKQHLSNILTTFSSKYFDECATYFSCTSDFARVFYRNGLFGSMYHLSLT